MSDDLPLGTKDSNPATKGEHRESRRGESAEQRADDHERTRDKDDRPYGHKNVMVGVVAAAINAVLVVVLIFQTLAVRDQLELSGEALERNNASFLDTLDEMRQQREAMISQVESVKSLTSTLEQIFRDQQRARLSFRVALEEIDDVQTGIRLVHPIEIGGTTEARQVHFKNYRSVGKPGQQQFLEDLELDWSQRKSHPLTDISPTEVGRQFVTPVLAHTTVRSIVSGDESLYFVGRLEYCDVYGMCRYFMRCAELGKQPGVITYCGTRVGDLQFASP